MPDNWLTLAAAAAQSGIHRESLRQYIRAGLLPAEKVDPTKRSSAWLIHADDLAALVEKKNKGLLPKRGKRKRKEAK